MKEMLEQYLHQVLGQKCELFAFSATADLPMFYTSQYTFYRTEIRSTVCVLCLIKSNVQIAPMYLEGQMHFLKEHLKVPVVYCTRQLEYHATVRILSRGIPLLIPGKVLSLPFLPLILNYASKGRQLAREKFSKTAQLVVIVFLLHRLPSSFSIRAVVENTGCSYALAANALEELRQLELGSKNTLSDGHGVEFHFVFQGKELWDACQEYFFNPCKYTIGTIEGKEKITGIKAGANALSDRTMLGESKPDVIAMTLSDFRKAPLPRIPVASAELLLQLWQYKPDIYGENAIDPLSLYLSLKEDKDERIQMALEEMMGGFQW